MRKKTIKNNMSTQNTKKVTKKVEAEDAENERRVRDTIERIQSALADNKTALQSYIFEARGDSGVLLGSSPQVRVVLNNPEQPDLAKKVQTDDNNKED